MNTTTKQSIKTPLAKKSFFSEFSKRVGGRNGFAYLNTKCFH